MAGNVVVDGSEPVRTVGTPSPLWMALAGFAALLAVVATLQAGPQPAPPPVGPEETFPELEAGVDGWRRLVLPGSGPLAAVAQRDERVVAGGAGPQFWWSDDAGATWHLSGSRGADPGAVTGVAVGERAAVAVGGVSDPTSGDALRAGLWVSGGGEHWAEVTPSLGGQDSGLDGVVEFEGRFVAWGWTGDPDDFAPGVGPLLVTSVGGEVWEPIDLSESGTRLRAVVRAGGRWLAMGSREGQPTLWTSADLEQWDQVPTDRMPFGWTMVDAYDDGTLTVNLLDPGSGATHRFRQLEDGTWVPLGDPVAGGPVSMERDLDGLSGVGAGRLWITDPGWEQLSLEGTLSAADGDVAVGEYAGQPVVWVRSRSGAPVVSPIESDVGLWEEWIELGPGPLVGPFPIGTGALVGTGEGWWFVDRHEAIRVDGLDGAVIDGISAVGDEWVVTPAMRWTTEGSRWEIRAMPWSMTSGGTVEAVTLAGGAALAVGTTDDGLLAAARSVDRGLTWTVTDPPRPSTPIRSIASVPDGFVGVAARPRNRSQVVSSSDGLSWADLPFEGLVGSGASVALVDDADVWVPGADHRFSRPPASPIDGVARAETGAVAVVSGSRLWLGPDRWQMVPMDPLAGVSGASHVPFFIEDGVVVASVDRGTVRLHRLTP